MYSTVRYQRFDGAEAEKLSTGGRRPDFQGFGFFLPSMSSTVISSKRAPPHSSATSTTPTPPPGFALRHCWSPMRNLQPVPLSRCPPAATSTPRWMTSPSSTTSSARGGLTSAVLSPQRHDGGRTRRRPQRRQPSRTMPTRASTLSDTTREASPSPTW